MSVCDLNERDRDIALQCVRYVLKGGYFDDDMDTRVGLTIAELENLLSEWPDLQYDDASQYASWGMNNCFNEVSHGITFSPAEWDKWFTATRTEVREAYNHWREIKKRIAPDNARGGLQ